MGAPFDHFLLTRFSAVMAPDAAPASEDWLYYRLGFFVDAALPSVLSQRGGQGFEWLVLLDDRCSAGFRDEVEELAQGTFTPIWTHEPFRRDSFAEHVAVRSHAPFVITTRMDSDDAIAVDFMASVQAQFVEQPQLFVGFPRGIQIERSGAVHRCDVLSNPFLSLIEARRDGEPPATVYVTKHARARGHGRLREVAAPPMWAQVLHGSNVSNIVNGVRVHPRVVGERFEIDLGYDASPSRTVLARGRVRQLGRLTSLWAAHPGELTKAAEATAWTLRGTHERAQESGAPTLTDRVQDWEQETRRRLRDARWSLKRWANERLPVREGLVGGELDDVLGRDRVVVLAEWSAGAAVRPDALRAARAWADAGFGVLVVAARDPWVRLRHTDVPIGVAVTRRGNTAYDFGSWAYALRTWPELAHQDLVVLTNDSLIGPLAPLDELLGRLVNSTTDVWGATANRWPAEHLQSYLLAFRGGVLARGPLATFWSDVTALESKSAVVRAYEVGLTEAVDRGGLTRDVGWSHAELGVPETVDLTLHGWHELLDAGFPFVKRILVTGPQFAQQRPAVEQAVVEAIADADRRSG
ncbi:hypothetical protein ASG73_08995 [Janibacter sp. Soil728]|uniref:glycosyltransferase n=1 Tax=Janibacter sp. Soil728 TaxID=1736393 RepID=UPI0006F4FEFE|nr:glycosyltransferase [Janibacter sp. Soil728]KRE37767.1 hypothetical protein ASG73_08995 [Janibacter sp. Soil728]